MAIFFDCYLFNKYAPNSSKTVLQVLLENNSEEFNNDKLNIYKSISESIQSLFLIQKVNDGSVNSINLFTDEIYLIQEKDSLLIFRKNDIFQGRIIYFQNHFRFTGNFCFHPKKTHKYIKSEINLIAKKSNTALCALNININQKIEKNSLEKNNLFTLKKTGPVLCYLTTINVKV